MQLLKCSVSFLTWSKVVAWEFLSGCQGVAMLLLEYSKCFLWRFSTAWYGTVRYGSLLGGFPLGTVPGTWYFFSTTSVEVPSSRTVTKTWRVNSADHWMAGENRHYCVTELATRDPPLQVLPARFKPAQPAKDRTQLLFKQTHIFASTTK